LGIALAIAGCVPGIARLRLGSEIVEATRLSTGATSRQLDVSISAAVEWLRGNQREDGHWVGRLETNSTMEAEWVLAMRFLGVKDDPKHAGVVKAIEDQQRPDGSWGVFYGAPDGDLSATVECYAALRCAGYAASDPRMESARKWIFSHGGLPGVRVFTKMWLALFGEWPWDGTPQLPPEMILFPVPWFPFNIYRFSSWARATLVPLTVMSAHRPVRPLPPEARLDELFPDGREAMDYRLPRRDGRFSWEGFFLLADRAMKLYRLLRFNPLRTTALRACLEWILRHQDADGAWGGIQPPWIYSLMALNVSGYPVTHPAMRAGIEAFNEPWAVRRGDAIYLQASNSPVWDTLLALIALLDCDPAAASEPFFRKAFDWVLKEEIRVPGDWAVTLKGVEPSGWAFEYENDLYPDVDDTAVALQLFGRLRRAEPALRPVIERALNWLMAMQSSNGGWASFDRDNDDPLVTKIPFSDFGETLDPPSVDVTAHALEAMGYLGEDLSKAGLRRALQYVLAEQEPDGSWFGRWGVNHVYGTGAVLPALRMAGFDMQSAPVQRAAAWLLEHQNADGGWGETCSSYMDDSLRGKGESTASQTGWALMGLLAVDSTECAPAIERGVEYLIQSQRADGTWDEPHYTGTGFPGYGLGRRAKLGLPIHSHAQGRELSRAFMLNYHMYRHYFPLMALGRARQWRTADGSRRPA
jgi:squalene-hopene/tetraprenyl-beta-curcumene cyclase